MIRLLSAAGTAAAGASAAKTAAGASAAELTAAASAAAGAATAKTAAESAKTAAESAGAAGRSCLESANFRTNRCATTNLIDDEKIGFTPIKSIILEKAAAVEFA